MQVLWSRGEAPATEVHEALSGRQLALTTIKTMLRKMDEKGMVRHREDGRTFVYSPNLAEAEVRLGMVNSLLDRLFGGDGSALVSHLVREGEVDPTELEELQARLAAEESEL